MVETREESCERARRAIRTTSRRGRVTLVPRGGGDKMTPSVTVTTLSTGLALGNARGPTPPGSRSHSFRL